MSLKVTDDLYVTLDKYPPVRGSYMSHTAEENLFRTVSSIKGDDVPQSYIYVIDKSTGNIIKYDHIIIDKDKKEILSKETRQLMEQDNSIETFFDCEFKIVADTDIKEFVRSWSEHDLIPFIYTRKDGKYYIFHKTQYWPLEDCPFDDLKIISALGHGPSHGNKPLLLVKKGDTWTILAEKIQGYHVNAHTLKPIYSTTDDIKKLIYTRSDGSSNARWSISQHQIIIEADKGTTVITIDRNNENVRRDEFGDAHLTPIDENGEYLLMIGGGRENIILRMDKDGYHKSKAKTWVADEKKYEFVTLPKNITWANAFDTYTWTDACYICDEDTGKLYFIKHNHGDKFMTLTEVKLTANDDNGGTWLALRKDGDTWYGKYKTKIMTSRDARNSKQDAEILTDAEMWLGHIYKDGSVTVSDLRKDLPQFMEIPMYKRRGDHYELIVPLNKKYNTDPIDYTEVESGRMIIEVFRSNVNDILEGNVPFDNMQLWWNGRN